MILYTIYDRPTDFPRDVVVRRSFILPEGVVMLEHRVGVFKSVTDARMAVSPGLTCVPRSPEDEPQIVESWI